jgi:hypothetical protein
MVRFGFRSLKRRPIMQVSRVVNNAPPEREYVVEKLTAVRAEAQGDNLELMFKVRWADPWDTPAWDTWETLETVNELEALDAFLQTRRWTSFMQTKAFAAFAEKHPFRVPV